MSGEVVVPGLDASTPVGFLAALGLLQVLDERAGPDERSRPCLAFRETGRWRPVFKGVESTEVLLADVRADVESWNDSLVLGFRYVKRRKNGPVRFGGLTPPLAVLRGWMRERLNADDQRSLAYMSALIAETATQVVDEEDLASLEQLTSEGISIDGAAAADRSCLQTFFDFSNRNIQFLDQIDCIREAIASSSMWVESELVRNEPTFDSVRSMGWDATAKVPGAQYPTRVAANRPVTEWLAFRGLVFLPIYGRGKNVQVTACHGRRLDGKFMWPVWVPFVTAQTVRSLLAYPSVELTKAKVRRALGVAQLFRSGLSKLGKYDAIITPSEPVGVVAEAADGAADWGSHGA